MKRSSAKSLNQFINLRTTDDSNLHSLFITKVKLINCFEIVLSIHLAALPDGNLLTQEIVHQIYTEATPSAFHKGSSIYNPLPQTEELPFSLHAHQCSSCLASVYDNRCLASCHCDLDLCFSLGLVMWMDCPPTSLLAISLTPLEKNVYSVPLPILKIIFFGSSLGFIWFYLVE